MAWWIVTSSFPFRIFTLYFFLSLSLTQTLFFISFAPAFRFFPSLFFGCSFSSTHFHSLTLFNYCACMERLFGLVQLCFYYSLCTGFSTSISFHFCYYCYGSCYWCWWCWWCWCCYCYTLIRCFFMSLNTFSSSSSLSLTHSLTYSCTDSVLLTTIQIAWIWAFY